MGISLRECKIRASLLLKHLLSSDPNHAHRAAERLRVLPEFAHHAVPEIISKRDFVQRKHALAVIAREQGFASWVELKEAHESESPRFDPESFFEHQGGVFLNRWFASYVEAREALKSQSGYLFPYRNQFFICDPDFLRALGVDTTDPDWERVGFNWIEPADAQARSRLDRKLVALGFADEESSHVE
jgi:hypothetical protein